MFVLKTTFVLESGTGEIRFLVGKSLTARLHFIDYPTYSKREIKVKHHVRIFVKIKFKLAKMFYRYKITPVEGILKF